MPSPDPPNDAAKKRSVRPEDAQPPEDVRDVGDVTLERAEPRATADLPLWALIRQSADALSFQAYSDFLEGLVCGPEAEARDETELSEGGFGLRLPFPDVRAYRLLKGATELFLVQSGDVALTDDSRV